MTGRWISLTWLALPLMLYLAEDSIAQDAQTELRRDAQRRLNLSGRQRMLSQRIAKAACLATRLSGNGELPKEMQEARALFISSMKALRSGSAEIGLLAENDAELLPWLDAAAELTSQYDSRVAAFASAPAEKRSQSELEAIYEMSLPLLTALNDVVEQLQAKHEDDRIVRPGLAHAINVSGRQRMLSQKMSKELCMIAVGYRIPSTRAHLMGTVALFESSHQMLQRGLPALDLKEKDSSAIAVQLSVIERHWRKLSEIFRRAAAGGDPVEADLRTIASDSSLLLIELNRAVEMYESIDIPAEATAVTSRQ
jgi:hypothetical protein